jgi:hypothetical protein
MVNDGFFAGFGKQILKLTAKRRMPDGSLTRRA